MIIIPELILKGVREGVLDRKHLDPLLTQFLEKWEIEDVPKYLTLFEKNFNALCPQPHLLSFCEYIDSCPSHSGLFLDIPFYLKEILQLGKVEIKIINSNLKFIVTVDNILYEKQLRECISEYYKETIIIKKRDNLL